MESIEEFNEINEFIWKIEYGYINYELNYNKNVFTIKGTYENQINTRSLIRKIAKYLKKYMLINNVNIYTKSYENYFKLYLNINGFNYELGSYCTIYTKHYKKNFEYIILTETLKKILFKCILKNIKKN